MVIYSVQNGTLLTGAFAGNPRRVAHNQIILHREPFTHEFHVDLVFDSEVQLASLNVMVAQTGRIHLAGLDCMRVVVHGNYLRIFEGLCAEKGEDARTTP